MALPGAPRGGRGTSPPYCSPCRVAWLRRARVSAHPAGGRDAGRGAAWHGSAADRWRWAGVQGWVEGVSDGSAGGRPPRPPRKQAGAVGSAHLERPRARRTAQLAGKVTRGAATAGARSGPDARAGAAVFPRRRGVGAAGAHAQSGGGAGCDAGAGVGAWSRSSAVRVPLRPGRRVRGACARGPQAWWARAASVRLQGASTGTSEREGGDPGE